MYKGPADIGTKYSMELMSLRGDPRLFPQAFLESYCDSGVLRLTVPSLWPVRVDVIPEGIPKLRIYKLGS